MCAGQARQHCSFVLAQGAFVLEMDTSPKTPPKRPAPGSPPNVKRARREQELDARLLRRLLALAEQAQQPEGPPAKRLELQPERETREDA
jgi:hypothetical protein